MPAEWTIPLGETAERVAGMYGISRQEQDAFALQSQQRAEAALAAGVFDDELIPVDAGRGTGPSMVCRDEGPRSGLSLEALGKLAPAFVPEGTVTAGSSSGINDGAAALSVAGPDALTELGLAPMARVVASAVAGVDPSCMGLGPIPATRKALQRARLSIDQIDLVELNEAFAVQALACIRELALDPERVNIYGGAIALGHPLGASGARIVTTLVHALRRTGGRYGLATMCIGVGQGIAIVVDASG
jgi:acetyl-CoA C-acetyltransferase/3-oxo-5,6-didehydrosuberyl-CoA/3-oxoadipyl-CoA thiolase